MIQAARGQAASPGKARGPLVTTLAQARAARDQGTPGILVAGDPGPEDMALVRLVAGVVTLHGGVTCDAAVAARALGLPCVVAVRRLALDPGTIIEVDGATGVVSCSPPASGQNRWATHGTNDES
jgi:phosphoenolpyruvate synthase/pyruvate phosphate dikinase